MHPRRQDGAETLPEAPAVPPGNNPAGCGGRYGKASPSYSHPHASQQLSVFLALAPLQHCRRSLGRGRVWVQLVKVQPFPSCALPRALSATTVTWGHKLPLLLPDTSLSCRLPALSTFPAASRAALAAWQGTADPLPAALASRWRRGIRDTVLNPAGSSMKKEKWSKKWTTVEVVLSYLDNQVF